jgi:hypothetical protein
MATENINESNPDAQWIGGYVTGLLTARYYALRHPMTDVIFRFAAPSETPEVVCSLLQSMCRVALDQRLFETSWASLDHYLLCDSVTELQTALAMIPDKLLQ